MKKTQPEKQIKKTTKKKKKAKTKLTKQQVQESAALIEAAFEEDRESTIFFFTWLKCNRNATKAYKELHPDVTNESAMVLGSRQLRKVKVELILSAYGLDHDAYFKQLNQGLNAKRTLVVDDNVIEVPDHKVRKDYHKTLGELLGIEKDNGVKAQVNIQNVIGAWMKGGE